MPNGCTQQKYDYSKAMEQLVNVVQELSIDRDLQAIMSIVRPEKYSLSLDETGQDCIRRARRSAERCQKTIDDLLTLSRTTRGVLNRQPVNLASIAREIVSELKENGFTHL